MSTPERVCPYRGKHEARRGRLYLVGAGRPVWTRPGWRCPTQSGGKAFTYTQPVNERYPNGRGIDSTKGVCMGQTPNIAGAHAIDSSIGSARGALSSTIRRAGRSRPASTRPVLSH